MTLFIKKKKKVGWKENLGEDDNNTLDEKLS